MAEGPLIMVLHGALIALVLYLVMVYILGQSSPMALSRSVLIGSIAVAYMVLFGHGLPGRVNYLVVG